MSTNSTLIGQVKWFNNKTGYGFITALSEGEYKGKDIFAHYSNVKITHSQYKYLVQGEYVEFNAVKPDHGQHEFHAVDINGILGGSLMCEIRHAMTQENANRASRNENGDSEWQTSSSNRRPNRRNDSQAPQTPHTPQTPRD